MFRKLSLIQYLALLCPRLTNLAAVYTQKNTSLSYVSSFITTKERTPSVYAANASATWRCFGFQYPWSLFKTELEIYRYHIVSTVVKGNVSVVTMIYKHMSIQVVGMFSFLMCDTFVEFVKKFVYHQHISISNSLEKQN